MIDDAVHAAGQVWPAFALVTGLILVGIVAERDGLFAAAGAFLARMPGRTLAVYCVSLALVTFVTAILNLDTAVVFLTPVLLHLARARRVDEAPFVYGAVMMANAGSLFLPGSNLTNLIVLHGEHVSGATFLARMWAPALAAPLATTAVLVFLFRRELSADGPRLDERVSPRRGLGLAAIVVSTVLVLVLVSPALPVLVVGLVTIALARVPWRQAAAVADPRVLVGLFALAVVLGAIGRAWTWPSHLAESYGRAGAALVAALAALCVNNLPAAVVLAPHPPTYARALLLGLNLGPNLAVTGSLSAFLWLRVARSLGARPTAREYTRVGLVAAPVALAVSLAALVWL